MRRLSTALISVTCLGLVLAIAPAVQAASLAAPTWTPAHRLNSAPGTAYLDGPHVAASSSGAAVIFWVALRNPNMPRRRAVGVYAAVKSPAGAWTPPHRLAVTRGRASVTRGANAAWVGIDRRGRAIVLWTTPDPNAADFWSVHWSRHLPGGTWSRPTALDTTIYKYDVVRPEFAMAPSGRGVLAYAEPSAPKTLSRSGNVGFVRRFFPDASWGRPTRITSADPPAPRRGGIGVTHMSAGIADTGAVTAIWVWQIRLTSQGPVDRGERGGLGPRGRRLRIEPADRSGGGDIAVSPNGSVAYLAGGDARRLVTRTPGGAWTITALPGAAGTTPFGVEFALSDTGVTLWWVSVEPGGTGSAELLSTSNLRADGTWTDPAVLYRSTERAVVEVHGARGGADTDVAWFTRPQQGFGTGHTTLRSTSPGGVTTVHTTSNGPRSDLAAAGDHAVFAWENRVPRGADHPVWTKTR